MKYYRKQYAEIFKKYDLTSQYNKVNERFDIDSDTTIGDNEPELKDTFFGSITESISQILAFIPWHWVLLAALLYWIFNS